MTNEELHKKVDELRTLKQNAIDAERACGDHLGIVDLLAHQYADKTHFIFELLQNADDTEATSVEFHLYDDRLEFSHNGKRLFNYCNIESIVAIGKSPKDRDYTMIGRHGIGFKAVFAYTHKSRVYSGPIAFDIVEGRIPVLFDGMPPNFDANETRFIFPFDTDEILPDQRFRELVPAKNAHSEIYQRLQDLSLRTPLCLKHIDSIQWKIDGQTKGKIIRNSKPILNSNAFRVELTDDNCSESWIVFFRDVVIDADPKDFDEEGNPPCGTVKVAFLEKDGHIVKVDSTELVVFFPTAVKTGLGFIIHGPFKTTKARDNIKGLESNNRHTDPTNNQIIDAAAQLAADSLETLCELGLMNVSSYLALPLRDSDFPEQSFFRPVYARIHDHLRTKSLLPAHQGGFIKADKAKLAGVKSLVELFSSEQLSVLFCKEKLAWLDVSIISNSFTDFHTYLTSLADGIQVTPESLVSKLTADFLSKQSIAWLIKFIQYIEQGANKVLKRVPFVRLQSGKQVALPENMTVSSSTWFAPKETKEIDLSVFPLVHAELAENESVRTFLVKEGIGEIGAADIIAKSILPKFQGKEIFVEELNQSTYRNDLRRIVDAYVNANSLTKLQLTNELK